MMDSADAPSINVVGDTSETTDSVTEAAPEAQSDITEVLTVDGFDYDRVVAYIDESNLSLLIKTSTKAALEQARDNPEQLQALLATLRDQLGL